MTDLLRPREIAQSWNLNVLAIYAAIRRGHLPATRLPNGQLRVDRRDAAQVLAAGRIAPSAPATGPGEAT